MKNLQPKKKLVESLDLNLEEQSASPRRALLKKIGVSSGALAAASALPETWIKPVLNSVVLPAHAQTSECMPSIVSLELGGLQYNDGDTVQLDSSDDAGAIATLQSFELTTGDNCDDEQVTLNLEILANAMGGGDTFSIMPSRTISDSMVTFMLMALDGAGFSSMQTGTAVLNFEGQTFTINLNWSEPEPEPEPECAFAIVSLASDGMTYIDGDTITLDSTDDAAAITILQGFELTTSGDCDGEEVTLDLMILQNPMPAGDVFALMPSETVISSMAAFTLMPLDGANFLAMQTGSLVFGFGTATIEINLEW